MPELQNTSMAPSRIDGLVPVPYVGISFLQSWIFMLFYARSAGIEAAAPISLMSNSYMFSVIIMVLTVLAIAFWPSNLNDHLMSSTMKAVAPISLAISTAVLITCEMLGHLAPLCKLCGHGYLFWHHVSTMDNRLPTSGFTNAHMQLSRAYYRRHRHLRHRHVPAAYAHDGHYGYPPLCFWIHAARR